MFPVPLLANCRFVSVLVAVVFVSVQIIICFISVSTVVNGTRYTSTIDSGTAVSGGGGTLPLDATFAGATFTSGTSYQIRISFNSGSQLSLQAIAA